MVEILCGVLGGGAMGTDVGGIHIVERPMSTSQTFLAIDVGRFLPEGEFDSRMQKLVREVKSAHSASGFEEVLVAGEPEWRSEERRMRDGIPIDGVVWEKLKEIALKLEVSPPKEIRS
jgi:LDH2 family malate/lactate/ureidoglycolate dehydrogenase